MKVLKGSFEYLTIIKKSRFLAELNSVESQKDAREKLLEFKKKYKDATHVVHAFVVGKNGEVLGMSDDGEPCGTAGRPVLDVLKGSGITNCILTVTRWFGGTLLGTGGLVKAYGEAAKAVIAAAETEELVEKASFTFSCSYVEYEIIKRAVKDFNIAVESEDFSENVLIRGTIYLDEKDDFVNKIKDLTFGKVFVDFK